MVSNIFYIWLSLDFRSSEKGQSKMWSDLTLGGEEEKTWEKFNFSHTALFHNH